MMKIISGCIECTCVIGPHIKKKNQSKWWFFSLFGVQVVRIDVLRVRTTPYPASATGFVSSLNIAARIFTTFVEVGQAADVMTEYDVDGDANVDVDGAVPLVTLLKLVPMSIFPHLPAC